MCVVAKLNQTDKSSTEVLLQFLVKRNFPEMGHDRAIGCSLRIGYSARRSWKHAMFVFPIGGLGVSTVPNHIGGENAKLFDLRGC